MSEMLKNIVVFLDIDGVLNSNKFHADWIQEHAKLHENPLECEKEAIVLEQKFDSLFTNVTGQEFLDGYIAPPNLGLWNNMIGVLTRTFQNTKVVLSSDWRYIQDGTYSNVAPIGVIKELFKVRGINGDVIGATPHVYPQNRGKEIALFINEYMHTHKHTFTHFLVLDDLDVFDSINENREAGLNCAVFHCFINSEYGLNANTVGCVFRYFGIMGDIKDEKDSRQSCN